MDLVDLFIGAEGTLGIVSEIEVALAPALQETFDLVAFFSSEELATIFHFPNKTVETPHIHWVTSKKAPAPAEIKTEPEEDPSAKAAIQTDTLAEIYYVLGQFQKAVDTQKKALLEGQEGTHTTRDYLEKQLKKFEKALSDSANPSAKK
jgi:FAD/FMN-containing dehydrogenase